MQKFGEMTECHLQKLGMVADDNTLNYDKGLELLQDYKGPADVSKKNNLLCLL